MKPTMDGDLCQKCRVKTKLDGGWCVGVRANQLKALLDRYKFDSARRAGRVCAELLDEQLPSLPGNVVIMPVPTAPAHRRVRGFDHTHIIARRFAKTRNLAFSTALVRVDSSGTQHFKSRAERLHTAAKGLKVHGKLPDTILLIDDIYTTGATLHACAQILRAHGVKQLFVAVIARQVLDESNHL